MSKKLSKRHKQAIKHILENFNFYAVHQIMLEMDWRWYDSSKDVEEVPTVKKLRRTAREVLEAVIMYGRTEQFSTGGFEARLVREDTPDTDWLELKFILDEQAYSIGKDDK